MSSNTTIYDVPDGRPPIPSKSVVIGTSSFFMAVTLVVVGLRVLSRHVCKVRLDVDDAFMLVAVPVFWIQCSVAMAGLIIGAHAKDYDTPEYETLTKFTFISSALYCIVILTTNLSILCLYWRLFPLPGSRRMTAIMMLLMVLWFIPTFTVGIFACDTVDVWWIMDKQGECIYFSTYWLITGIAELLLETVIFIIPLYHITLHCLNNVKKVLLIGLFSIGGLSLITQICRLQQSYIPHDQFIHDTVWIYVHTGASILCACLPTLRPLLARIPAYVHRSFSSRNDQMTIREEPLQPLQGVVVSRSYQTEIFKPKPESVREVI